MPHRSPAHRQPPLTAHRPSPDRAQGGRDGLSAGHTLLRPLAAILAATALSGCFADRQAAARKLYTQPPQIEVRQDKESWVVPPEILGADPAVLNAQLHAVADDYHRRGTGPVLVVATAPARVDGEGWAALVREMLVRHGVEAAAITTTTLTAGPTGATVSYPAATMVAPACGDTPFAYGTTLGCSIDQNIAQMIARPKDLYGNEGVAAYDSRTATEAVQRSLRNREPAQDQGLITVLQELTTVE